jgi:hypothetical protein
MSCCNNDNAYSNVCRQDIPYPQVSHESVPSLIDNLVYALYGTITKSVVNGRVTWNIPCDPNSTAQVPTIPRNEGEGSLCYILRVFQETVGQYSPFQFWSFTGNGTTTTYSLPPSLNTLASSYLVYLNGVVQPPAAYNISNTSPVNIVFQSAPTNNTAITVLNLGYTPPYVIDVTQSEATPTGSSSTQTMGAWLQQILYTLSQPVAGVPQGGLRWVLNGNGITTTLALAGATTSNPTGYLVAIDGVVQDPAGYTINSAVSPFTITVSQPVPNGSVMVVIEIASAIAGWYAGNGNPNGVLVAPIGSIYVNKLGGQGQTFWVKETGTGNTGWTPLSSGTSGPPVPAGGNSWRFIGNGSTAIYPLAGATATTAVSYIASIDGVLQDPIDYIIDTSANPFNFVFNTTIPNLSKLVIVG